MGKQLSYNLTIITINYNDQDGLKKTVDSVIAQSLSNFEYIVIDGNSDDGSVEFLETIKRNHFKYVSQQDLGIYNAMNKGINMASGKYLLFLNSGDFLENKDVVTSVMPYLDNEYSILSGNLIFDENKVKRLRESPNKISFSYLVGNAISHPSTFIKRDLFSKYGNYDESYKIVSDWAFFMKILGLNNETYLKLPLTISVFDTQGVSSKEGNYKAIYAERQQVLESFFPRVFNNENDTYIFNKFKGTNKRFKYLKIIDNYPFFRKIATLKLGALVWIIKLFHKTK
jgi:glycosyltransferase involved in cell wall biosynthesis